MIYSGLMHIGLVSDCYFPVVNGVTQSIALHQKILIEMGLQASVFTLSAARVTNDQRDVIRSRGVPVGHGYAVATRFNRTARELLAKVDIVHCHHPVFAVGFARRYTSVPVVYTSHTRYDLYAPVYLPLPGRLGTELIRRIWPLLADRADAVICPSRRMANTLERLGVSRPVFVIQNGVDLKRFMRSELTFTRKQLGIAETKVVCVHVGRISAEKNVRDLLNAFAIAHRSIPDLHLMFIGAGSCMRSLKSQTSRLGIAGAVTFTGQVPPRDIPAMLAASDLYVSASKSEVMPLSAIEAQAAGLPIVAFDAPGFDEIVEHGVTGILSRHLPWELAGAITMLAEDKDTRTEMSLRAQQSSLRFDIYRTVQELLLVYEKLLSSDPSRVRDGHSLSAAEAGKRT